jgi:hypothetical protein
VHLQPPNVGELEWVADVHQCAKSEFMECLVLQYEAECLKEGQELQDFTMSPMES